MTTSDVPISVTGSAGTARWRRRSGWLPLLLVLANFTFLIVWSRVALLLLQNVAAPWTWADALQHFRIGWSLSYLPLVSIWLVFGDGRTWIRWPAAAACVAVGSLLPVAEFWGGFNSVRTLSFYLPQWSAALLLSAELIAGMHLVLYPLRLLLGWRLSFTPPPALPAGERRFQFSTRDLFCVTIATAVALAIIRGCYFSLARGKSEVLMVPMLVVLLWFGQILIPSLACAWLLFAVKRQWIGGMVLGLSLACPMILVWTGWNVPLSMSARALWWGHWMNLGGAGCVAANLLLLRLCGLRLAIKARGHSRVLSVPV